MKVYISHSRKYDYKNQLYKPLQNIKDFDFVFPHLINEFTNSKETIKNCDAVIAEISYPSIGTGIELAWADQFGIPIILLHKTNINPSNSVRIFTDNIIEYSDSDELILKLPQAISKLIT